MTIYHKTGSISAKSGLTGQILARNDGPCHEQVLYPPKHQRATENEGARARMLQYPSGLPLPHCAQHH